METYWNAMEPYREQGITLADWAHGTVSTLCECEPDSDCECYYYDRKWWSDCLTDAFSDLAPWGEAHLWRVEGLPLWSGDVAGTAEVTTPDDLLRAVTVNADYRLSWQVEEGDDDERYLSLTLSHHDVPTGRSFTARPVAEADSE